MMNFTPKLYPIIHKPNKKKTFGFDIETYHTDLDGNEVYNIKDEYGDKFFYNDGMPYDGDVENKFLMASIVGDDYEEIFLTKRAFIDELRHHRFRNSYMVATNLSFDFLGIFHNEPEELMIRPLYRGSHLILAKAYVNNEGFHPKNDKDRWLITFIDTMNFAMLSVEKQGKILGLPKLDKPRDFGRFPSSLERWDEMIDYNIRDSKVTKSFIDFLFKGFQDLGGNVCSTIASTSMTLFKCRFLKDTFFVHNKDVLREQFKGYYGGRTEAFRRGYFDSEKIGEVNYFDLNSLYPFCMKHFEYPDPNTLCPTFHSGMRYIDNYDGMSEVSVECPYIHKPFLPVRTKDKLLFPYGSFRGWYTHFEIREAIKLGYKVRRVHKTYYYNKNIKPFVEFVDVLYNLRLKYKEMGNPMEYVVKILLNSFYGKTAQRFDDRDNWIPADLILEELEKYMEQGDVDRIGNYFRVVAKDGTPAGFCFPIWASHITAYARYTLYQAIKNYDPFYVDTDSIVTLDKVPEGKGLGEWKKEMVVKEGVIVRPKFYALKSDVKDYVKVKGLGVRLGYLEFMGFLKVRRIDYKKFSTFKETIRMGMNSNRIRNVHKMMSLDDQKREWGGNFDMDKFEQSRPRLVIDGEVQESPIFTMQKLEKRLYS